MGFFLFVLTPYCLCWGIGILVIGKGERSWNRAHFRGNYSCCHKSSPLHEAFTCLNPSHSVACEKTAANGSQGSAINGYSLSLSLRPRCILGQRYCESCCRWPLPTVIIYPAPVSLGSASHLFSSQGLFKLLSLSPCTISSTFTCQLNCLFSESQTFLLFSLLTRAVQPVL